MAADSRHVQFPNVSEEQLHGEQGHGNEGDFEQDQSVRSSPRPQSHGSLRAHRDRREQNRNDEQDGRRRSSSDPSGRSRQRPGLSVLRGRRQSGAGMPTLPENNRLTSTAVFNAPGGRNEQLDQGLADVLDVIDPEVSTLNNVTNIQNSLFVPSLGRFVNRRPTFNLSRAPERLETSGRRTGVAGKRTELATIRDDEKGYEYNFAHAVLPDGVSLQGWTEEEMAELNDHVRHMLHSRRSKFKRTMRAFGQYVRKPLGFFVTLYATLITLFGLAWVLFLIGWIYVGQKTPYVSNVIDYVLVALFGLVGDGLAPFRLVDTYHMAFIAHYHRLTWKLRKQKHMAKLRDKNDLPTDPELEAERDEVSVLSEEQQARLVYHQNKFARSHTFYKPHETKTHHAFPLNFLIAVVVLLDLHSCLQISLGATTWGIDWHTRPAAITATILCVSITVNITAGILIMIGGRRTRKKDVVERMFRQELTREAIDQLRHRGKKEGDVELRMKAEKALDEGRKSETLDEALRSDVPIHRQSVDVARLPQARRSMDVPGRSGPDRKSFLQKLPTPVRHSMDSRRPTVKELE
ncbi:hypothetical protein F4780DRAFT_8889 [Xylariomycetidae sp. FL0641]|nr:hypothetical protein F4780DRAFT_8889 [Xylariomycetidae sp. FL0641]